MKCSASRPGTFHPMPPYYQLYAISGMASRPGAFHPMPPRPLSFPHSSAPHSSVKNLHLPALLYIPALPRHGDLHRLRGPSPPSPLVSPRLVTWTELNNASLLTAYHRLSPAAATGGEWLLPPGGGVWGRRKKAKSTRGHEDAKRASCLKFVLHH